MGSPAVNYEIEAPSQSGTKYEVEPPEQAKPQSMLSLLAHPIDNAEAIGQKVVHDAAPFVESLYPVRIATEGYKHFTGQPSNLSGIAEDALKDFSVAAAGAPEAESSTSAARPSAPPPRIAAPEPQPIQPAPSTMASRVAEVAKRRVHAIPGVQAAKDAMYIFRGEPEVSPLPSTPAPPPEFGKGTFGTPIDKWGTRIAAPPTAGPAPIAAAPVTKKAVSSAVDNALNVQPLKPNVPLREQLPAIRGEAQSSVVKSSSYDPGTKEFTTHTHTGTGYVHGEVTQEEADAFAKADSKGKAWNEIRKNHPLVAKIVDGKRVPIKANAAVKLADAESANGEDLTRILRNSLEEVQRRKAHP